MSDLTPTIRGATPTHVVSHHQTLAQSLGTLAVPILLGVTLLASFALRLYCLDCHGFWGDEVASLEGAALGFPDMVTGRFGWIANQTPLHYMLVWLTTLPLDPRESEFLVRLPQALAGALNVLNAYLALTLFVPALFPYLAWIAWGLWKRRAEEKRAFVGGALAMSALAAVCLAAYADLASVPRVAPNLGNLSLLTPLTSAVELVTWMSRLGIGGQLERLVQALLLIAATGGAFAALRERRTRRYAVLLLHCILVPAFLLAVLSTTSAVFERYAIFVAPLYFLLVSNGLHSLYALTTPLRAATTGRSLSFLQPSLRYAGGGASIMLLAMFMWNALAYHTPNGHRSAAYRPDFRGVAGYLAAYAGPQDLIIFVDDPALGYATTGYYLGGAFPAPAYDARDPRLYSRQVNGSIYWVASAENLPDLETAPLPDGHYQETARFTRVLLLRESRPDGGLIAASERIVERLQALGFRSQPIWTLRGTLKQARGDLAGAAADYRAAGIYFPLGREYIRTAQGFEARGDPARAWREAVISKFCEPANPDVRLFMSHKLEVDGHVAESRIEAQIAEILKLGNTPR